MEELLAIFRLDSVESITTQYETNRYAHHKQTEIAVSRRVEGMDRFQRHFSKATRFVHSSFSYRP